MRFNSTRNRTSTVDLPTAVLTGLAPDGGLYLPERLPSLPHAFWDQLPNLDFIEVATDFLAALVGNALAKDELRATIEGAFTFDAPLVPVTDRISVLELFHGPTLAFKDFGARFMARLMLKLRGTRKLTVLVATSGDTGAAVAAGFHRVPGIDVYVLYPSQRVSPLQEKQLTTWGDNITALEIEGTFDDCQRMVKAAFLDPGLSDLGLTSANSINIARLLPQCTYYLRAMQQLRRAEPVVFSVPSGNLGNVCAGIMAHLVGLPVERFVVAQNANDAFEQYLQTGVVPERRATRTLSNAMDVSVPSNLERLTGLLSLEQLRHLTMSSTLDDQGTLAVMARVDRAHGVVLDPHTAVGWHGAEQALDQLGPGVQAIVLATAHPAKFPEVVEEAMGRRSDTPERLRSMVDRRKVAYRLPPDHQALEDALRGRLSALSAD